jgi:aspartyl-tRNA(Asn)/glutamyl-tRNA(Gln) amidotransferase subunit A
MIGTRLTIEQFGHGLRAGKTTSADVTAECLKNIDAGQATLNAFIRVMADEARLAAAEADRELAAGIDRGPLHGVPISVKDLFDVAGTGTTAASRVRDGHVAAVDAPAIALMRRAGAILVGKTNLHEFAFGTTNEDSAFGPARNPHDPSRSPGGSSGGSAASVAAGMALATLGTDTGGSIRIPAAACGLVGLKPAYGELSADGVVPLSRTLDHIGPLALTVTDAHHLYGALAGQSPSAPLAATPLPGLRAGILRPYFCDLLDDDVRAAFESALERIGRAGLRSETTAIRNAADISTIYLHLVLGDAAAYHAATLESMPDRYTPAVRQRLEMGRHVLAEDYVRALNGRELLRRQVDAALSVFDVLLLPTLPIVAPPVGAAMVRVGTGEEPVRNVMLRLTQLFNLTGHPAITLPCQAPGSLPVGLQIVGRRGGTRTLLPIALAVEAALAH